jgi:hypothetical protein
MDLIHQSSYEDPTDDTDDTDENLSHDLEEYGCCMMNCSIRGSPKPIQS